MRDSKKVLLWASVFFLVISFCGCNTQGNDSAGSDTNGSVGSLEGKALFSNLKDNSGITVSVDKADGPLTASIRSVLSGDTPQSRTVTSSRNAVTVSAKTDGTFKIENIEPGTYTVEASSSVSNKKAVQTDIVVEAGKNTVIGDMQLTAVGQISGRVRLDGATSGNLGFLVFIAGTSYMAVTDDAGAFTISDVPVKDNYTIVVSKNSYVFVWGPATTTAGATIDMGVKTVASSDLTASNSYLVWKGSLSAAPANPQVNWAYYNVLDNKTYYFNGIIWCTLAQSLNGNLSDFYTITFDSMGGPSVSTMYTNKVGAEVLNIPNGGYGLAGWYTSADLLESNKVTFPYVPTSDKTLYARWVPGTAGFVYALSSSTSGYVIYPGTALLSGPIQIPSYWQGIPVTEISAKCFDSSSISGTLSLPEKLVVIGDFAFHSCYSLTGSLNIPEGVTTIGQYAFDCCNHLNGTITLPSTITAIGQKGLSGNDTTRVIINAVNPPQMSGPNTFNGCWSLTAIQVPTASVAAYQGDTNWSHYASLIVSQ